MQAALDITNLHKTYGNGFEALKGIDLHVNHGDFFALLGPNGAGKSTTIGIITSLINKTSGTVKVYGKDLDTELGEAKSHLGLVPQEFNFNVFEPVVEIVVNQAGYYGIPRAEAFEKADALLHQLGLYEKRREMARNLSGGMKRRLMIARALVHEPRLLILDEPTAGVDIEIRHSMWDFLQKINSEGTTIILTTHYLEEAENLCKNIAIIDHGRIIENTSIKALLMQLNTETFILDLQNPIETLPEINGYQVRMKDNTCLEVEIDKKQHINDLFNELTKHHVHVSSMRNKVNRLEELFIRILKQER